MVDEFIFFFFFFFFFQAEDGIRDWSVTGVQTCALPILRRCRSAPRGADGRSAIPASAVFRSTAFSKRPVLCRGIRTAPVARRRNRRIEWEFRAAPPFSLRGGARKSWPVPGEKRRATSRRK